MLRRFVSLAMACGLSSVATASLVIDQVQDVFEPTTMHEGLWPNNLAWQSFTAGTDGQLAAIDLQVGINAPNGFTFNIYEGEGTGGTLLSSLPFYEQTWSYQWTRLTLLTQPTLTAGQVYTFAFEGTVSNAVVRRSPVGGAGVDYYPQGKYYNAAYYEGPITNIDLGFQTVMSVPEPTALGLASVTVSLVALRRKRTGR